MTIIKTFFLIAAFNQGIISVPGFATWEDCNKQANIVTRSFLGKLVKVAVVCVEVTGPDLKAIIRPPT